MEILTGGSFINLDNREKINALVHTARVMAETAVETEGFVNEAGNNRQIADDIWQGAEYMCREHEAQQVKNIFVNNFLDRLKEFKTNELVQPVTATTRVVEPENGNYHSVDVAAQSETDEFLGHVAADDSKQKAQEVNAADEESVSAERSREQNSLTNSLIATETNAGNETNQESALTTPTLEADSQNLQLDRANDDRKNEQADDSIAESTVQDEASVSSRTSEAAIVTPALEIEAVKLPEKEPYQFDKCTVTTTIQLLPVEADRERRAVVSVRTHDFAPQIWTLKFPSETGLDALLPFVNQALNHYSQELPIKVMDKMRKEKSSGKKHVATTAKPAVADKSSVATTAAQSSSTKNDSAATNPVSQTLQTQQPLAGSSIQQVEKANSSAKIIPNTVVAAKPATKSIPKTDTAQGSLF